MESAEGLYSRLEEELHDLVSQSNSCLEHLEFLRKVQELEAKFGKVRWASLGCRSGSRKLKLSSAVFPRLSVLSTFPQFLMMKEAQRITGLPEL